MIFWILTLTLYASDSDDDMPPSSARCQAKIFQLNDSTVVKLYSSTNADKRNNLYGVTCDGDSPLKALMRFSPWYGQDFDLNDETERGFKFKHKRDRAIVWLYKPGQKSSDGALTILAHVVVTGQQEIAERNYSEQILVRQDGTVFVQNGKKEILAECGSVAGFSQSL